MVECDGRREQWKGEQGPAQLGWLCTAQEHLGRRRLGGREPKGLEALAKEAPFPSIQSYQ